MRRVRHGHDDGVQAQAHRLGERAHRVGDAVAGGHAVRTVGDGSTTATKSKRARSSAKRDRVRGLADEPRADERDPQATALAVHRVPRPHVPAGPPLHTLERSYWRGDARTAGTGWSTNWTNGVVQSGHVSVTAISVRRASEARRILQRGNGIRRSRTATAPAPDELGERLRLPGERVQHGLVAVVGVEHRRSFVACGAEDLDRDEIALRDSACRATPRPWRRRRGRAGPVRCRRPVGPADRARGSGRRRRRSPTDPSTTG